jgi:hypothetical protein
LLLSGCGSGSTDAETGYLIDGAVAGVDYRTDTKSGVTKSDGSFEYNPNDRQVTFFIGALKLATLDISNIKDDNKVLLADLAGVDRNNTTDTNVTKMFLLLQSLDDDGDPDNGITITDDIKDSFTLSQTLFDLDITTIRSLIISAGKTPKNELDAREHYEKTLRGLGYDVDTIAPRQLTRTVEQNSTTTLTTSIEINGEVGAKIFIGAVDTNQTIGSNGRATIDLDTSTLGENNFTIYLEDAKGNRSSGYSFNITRQNSATVLYISCAVYDNNRTALTSDDKLYIYFNKSIDPDTITTDISGSYDINGTGTIGSGSRGEYNSSIFYRHSIVNDSSTGGVAFDTYGSKIAIRPNTITDTNGSYPQDFNQTAVESFSIYARLKTGQTTSYVASDDGATQRGVARNFTREGVNNTVTDHITGLMWQDNSEAKTTNKTWSEAITYCEGLSLGGYNNWRLPSVEELMSITDKGRYNLSIDPVFTNVVSDSYWSATTDASYTSYAWGVYFYYGGYVYWYDKTYSYYVRCVRPSD